MVHTVKSDCYFQNSKTSPIRSSLVQNCIMFGCIFPSTFLKLSRKFIPLFARPATQWWSLQSSFSERIFHPGHHHPSWKSSKLITVLIARMFIHLLLEKFIGNVILRFVRIVGYPFLAAKNVFENFHWKGMILKVCEFCSQSLKRLISGVWEGNIGQWEKLSENYLANEPVCDLTRKRYFQEKVVEIYRFISNKHVFSLLCWYKRLLFQRNWQKLT